MIDPISAYLDTLKGELAGNDAATLQDALSDAEDHLRSALANLLEEQPELSQEEALASIIEDFGEPDEVASAYKEIETRFPPALARPHQPRKRGFWGSFFGVITEPRTWGALLYMILSLVTGIIYFTWVVTGLSTSAGLIILIIGLPFFGLFLLSVKGIALVEGRIVEALLGIQMPRRPVFIDSQLSLWGRFKVLVSDSRTWLAMLYMLLMLPLGTIYFSLFITILSTSLAFLATPILRWVFGQHIVYGDGLMTSVILPSPDYWIPLLVVVGVAMLFGSMHLAKFLGHLHGKFAKFMLVRS
jgi:hypothetical protein